MAHSNPSVMVLFIIMNKMESELSAKSKMYLFLMGNN